MATSGLRARVERLLSGKTQAEDLSRLLLFARDHCDGRRTVIEVGDFIAHHNDRTKGLLTDEARDWFLTTSFLLPRLRKGLDLGNLPPNFFEVLAASYRRVGPKTVRSHAGLRYADALKMLTTMKSKFSANRDGTLSVTRALTAKELALLQTLCGHIVARPAFDAQKLHADFEASLRSNGLLRKDEARKFADAMPALALLAVAEMHNCNLHLSEGQKCQLGASVSDGTIAVNAPVPCTLENGTIFISQRIFSTELPAATYCAPSLLKVAEPWTMDLEPLFPEIQIGPLG